MKSLMITAIFAILGTQSVYAANSVLVCDYVGDAGDTSRIEINDTLGGTAVTTLKLEDGDEMELPGAAHGALGIKNGNFAIVVSWGSPFISMTSVLPIDLENAPNVVSGLVYDLSQFDDNGPVASRAGTITCKSPEPEKMRTLLMKSMK